MQPEDKGWTTIKTKRRKRIPPVKEEKDYKTVPIRRFWLGFDDTGSEKWFIELNNHKIISYTDESYNYWLKRYIYKDRQ